MRRDRTRLLPALMLALLLAACGGKGEAELLGSAKTYLDKKDAKAAVIELKNLLDKNPASGEARLLLGQALLETGDAAGAEAELRRAAELNIAEARVVPLRARALLAQGQARKLTEEFGSTELKDPIQDIELQTTLATAYALQGASAEARTAIDKALAISPSYAPAVITSARLKAAEGDADAALAAVNELLGKSPDNVEALQFKGDLLLHAKDDRAGATAAYTKALSLRADLAEVHNALFSMALQQRDVEAAARQLEALKKARPGHATARMMEAQLAFAKNDFKQARELLQPLVQGAPNNVRVLMLAGASELQLGTLQQAEVLLARAVQQAPNLVEARRLLADVYLRTRQPEKALATLKPVVESARVTAPVLALAAQAYLQNGDSKTAEGLFAKAAKLKPEDKRLNAAVALSQINKGNGDAAFAELQRLAASDEGRAVDMALITARLQRKEFDLALKAIDQLEKKQAESPMPAQLRGRVLLARKDAAGARAAFEQSLAKDPKYLPAAAGLAALDLQQNQPAAAQGRFEAVLKLDPRNTQALAALAELKARNGVSPAEIAKMFADAVSANPSDPAVRVAQIDFLAGSRDAKATLSAAQAAVAAVPNNSELLDRLGRAQLATEDREQALSTFGKLVALRPDASAGYIGLASARLAGKDLNNAQREVRRALEREPDSLVAHRMAIAIALRQQDAKEALAAARKLQERRPDDGAGYLAEGEIEAGQKHWDAAIAAFRKAMTKTDPAIGASRLHQTLVQAQRAPEAAKFAETWLKEHPDDPVFIFYLGDAAIAANDLPQAEARYLEVLKRQPENALALNNVAWLQMRQNKPTARGYAERAVKVAPGRPALMDTLAMVLAAEKQYPKALELQKQVVGQAPEVPGFRINLAKIYLESGDKKAARAELEQLGKLNKDLASHPEVQRLTKLTEG